MENDFKCRIDVIIDRLLVKPFSYYIFKPLNYCIISPLSKWIIQPLENSRAGKYIAQSERIRKAFIIFYFGYLTCTLTFATNVYVIPAVRKITETPEEFKQTVQKIGKKSINFYSITKIIKW